MSVCPSGLSIWSVHPSVNICNLVSPDVDIFFPVVSVIATTEDSATIMVELNGRTERDVSFSLESLDSLNLPDYATAGNI